ncbi:unnamed protein product [Sphacelaria rigidula]
MPNNKKNRSKEKKQARFAARTGDVPPSVQEAEGRIKAANATKDLSVGLEPFLAIDLPAPKSVTGAATPEPVRLKIRAPDTLEKGETKAMYDLLRNNMRELYMKAGWGWNAGEKYREMEHRDARFLIAECNGVGGGGNEIVDSDTRGGESVSSTDGTKREGLTAVGESKEAEGGGQGEARLAGYCHFRFAWDADENDDGEGVGGKEDVLYVYEIQVAPWATRRGLGRRMMQALELLANRHFMTKVMLTVFKENEQAMSFYTTKMRYCVDKDSPSNWDQPDEVYEILSKPTRHGLARARPQTTL